MELKDTVKDMCSDSYKRRFVAEYNQLNTRIQKLDKFIKSIYNAIARGQEEPKHDCPIDLLEEQLDAMNKYKDILVKRAVIEGISWYELQEM